MVAGRWGAEGDTWKRLRRIAAICPRHKTTYLLQIRLEGGEEKDSLVRSFVALPLTTIVVVVLTYHIANRILDRILLFVSTNPKASQPATSLNYHNTVGWISKYYITIRACVSHLGVADSVWSGGIFDLCTITNPFSFFLSFFLSFFALFGWSSYNNIKISFVQKQYPVYINSKNNQSKLRLLTGMDRNTICLNCVVDIRTCVYIFNVNNTRM